MNGRTSRWVFGFILLVGATVHATATAGEPSGMPLSYRRPSFYGYYPNGVPYQNYPYYYVPGYRYQQPYYHARPAYGGGFYHPGKSAGPDRRPIGRGL